MKFLRNIQVLLTVLCGMALLLGLLNLHPAMAYIAVACGSYFALRSAYESLRERSVDVNLLMVVAAVGAVAVGQTLDAAALLFLFSLSSTLESLAMARTRSAIEGLVKLRPSMVILITDQGDQKVPIEDLKLGDLVRVPPFEGIPVDGTVDAGRSSVDQSAMTGESVPVSRQASDAVIGGTRNLDGTLIVRVESTVGNSTLDKIVALVENAQDNKASGERISTWFGHRYTFFVLGVFALSLIIRLAISMPFAAALYSSLTLLVALSPCALVISTPATTLSALAWAARNGILIRGGMFIERAGKIDTVALDKTGTLTTGRPSLHEICVCAGSAVSVGAKAGECTDENACWVQGSEMSPEARELLIAAAAAEAYNAHPVADAIATAAADHGLKIPEATEQRSDPGLGVSAIVQGKRVVIGQLRYLVQEGIPTPPDFVAHVQHLQHDGMTVALIALDDRLAALGFLDTPRAETQEFLRLLKNVGIDKTLMITGDTAETAKAIGDELGIGDVRAGLLPAEKTKVIEELVGQKRHVMMVGDGVNDAPSLAMADIGVAMGGLGSDIALNAADVVLMHDRLDRIPELIRLGRKTNRIVQTNLVFAAGVIVILTATSLIGKLPLPIAVVGHEGSTVLVILNGLRLLRGPR